MPKQELGTLLGGCLGSEGTRWPQHRSCTHHRGFCEAEGKLISDRVRHTHYQWTREHLRVCRGCPRTSVSRSAYKDLIWRKNYSLSTQFRERDLQAPANRGFAKAYTEGTKEGAMQSFSTEGASWIPYTKGLCRAFIWRDLWTSFIQRGFVKPLGVLWSLCIKGTL